MIEMGEKEPDKGYEDLITELTNFFKNLKEEVIDNIVAEVKRRNRLRKLFDSQMETLKSRGCPQEILEVFQKQKSEVLNKASENKIEITEHIPFLPVIPHSYIGIYGLMSMVRNDEKVGYICLNPNEITDLVKAPKNPYFIYDVENGEDTLKYSLDNADKFVKEQNRSCLIADECIAMCIHTNVLFKHHVYTNSRYENGNKIIDICLKNKRPMLDWSSTNYSDAKWGFASCHSRI